MNGIHAAVRHGHQLIAQRGGLGARLPRREHVGACVNRGETGQAIEHEINARRQHQTVVRQGGAIGEGQRLFVRIKAGCLAADALDSVFVQAIVGDRNIGQRFRPAEHEIRHRARHKLRFALNERDVNFALAPHGDVLGRRCAAEAAADHDNFRFCSAADARATGNCRRAEQRQRTGRFNEVATIECVVHDPALLRLRNLF